MLRNATVLARAKGKRFAPCLRTSLDPHCARWLTEGVGPRGVRFTSRRRLPAASTSGQREQYDYVLRRTSEAVAVSYT